MKKILLFLLITLSAFSMFGCGNNDNKALVNFNKHLENTEAVIRNTSSSEIYEISPATNYGMVDLNNPIQLHRANSYENMMREENIRQQILSVSAYIKNIPNEKLKLSKNKKDILKQLNKNLEKYSTLLNDTKEDIRLSVNTIKRNLVIGKINVQNAERAYIALNNSMNERYTYLCNIYDNLQFAKGLINEELTFENNPTNENTQENAEDTTNKNIDSFDNSALENLNGQENTTGTLNNNIPQYNNYRNFINRGLDNNYGYRYYGYNRFNPNRNTDTFYPYNRNIDTYRFNPNYYNNFNNYNENGVMPLNNTQQDYQEKQFLNNSPAKEVCPECIQKT